MPIHPDTEFFAWHFMPYTALPDDVEDYDSLWVDFPNSHFDSTTVADKIPRISSKKEKR